MLQTPFFYFFVLLALLLDSCLKSLYNALSDLHTIVRLDLVTTVVPFQFL